MNELQEMAARVEAKEMLMVDVYDQIYDTMAPVTFVEVELCSCVCHVLMYETPVGLSGQFVL